MMCRSASRSAAALSAALLLPPPPNAAAMPGFVGARWGDEAETAREVARAIGAAPADLSAAHRSSVLWIHGGDAGPEERTPAAVAALSNRVAAGLGLVLTGSAVTWVNDLGLDRLTTKPLTFGHDRAQAGLVPASAGFRCFATSRPNAA